MLEVGTAGSPVRVEEGVGDTGGKDDSRFSLGSCEYGLAST